MKMRFAQESKDNPYSLSEIVSYSVGIIYAFSEKILFAKTFVVFCVFVLLCSVQVLRLRCLLYEFFMTPIELNIYLWYNIK